MCEYVCVSASLERAMKKEFGCGGGTVLMTLRRCRKIEILEKQLQRSCSNILHKISPGPPPPHLSLFSYCVCGDQG